MVKARSNKGQTVSHHKHCGAQSHRSQTPHPPPPGHQQLCTAIVEKAELGNQATEERREGGRGGSGASVIGAGSASEHSGEERDRKISDLHPDNFPLTPHPLPSLLTTAQIGHRSPVAHLHCSLHRHFPCAVLTSLCSSGSIWGRSVDFGGEVTEWIPSQ